MKRLRKVKHTVLLVLVLFLTGCPPYSVIILSPVNGTNFGVGEEITFNGSATDLIDGELAGNFLIWTSDQDNEMGKGKEVKKNDLSEGEHIITLSATNSIGETATATITITIGEKTSPTTSTTTSTTDLCGESFATSKSPISSITLESNQVNEDIAFFREGYSAEYFVPQPGFTVTAGVVVNDEGDIYVSALGIYLVASDGTFEHISSSGAFYLTIGSDGNLYTDSPENGNAIIRITPEGSESIVAQNLSSRIGALRNLAGSPDGYIYADAGISDEDDDLWMIRVNIDTGMVETISDSIIGPKTFDNDGNLLVIHGNYIYQMAESGQFEEVVCFTLPTDTTPEFYSIIIDDNGDFLVSETGMNSSEEPEKFTDQLGTRVFRIERSTGDIYTFADSFYGPSGLAQDQKGNILVAEMTSGALRKISSDGKLSTIIPGNLLANPMDIIFAHDGSLVISNAETGLLVKAAPTSSSTIEMSPYMTGFNLFAGVSDSYAYTSLVSGTAGNIYVAEYAPDITRKMVSKISTDDIVTSFITEINSPNGLTVDSDGNVWVSNAVSGTIEKYDGSGSLLGSTEALQTPSDITWYNGKVYVAEHGGNRILRIDQNFSVSTFADSITEPVDLAFSPKGDLLVTTSGTLYIVEGPVSETGDAEVLASLYPLPAAFQGVVFDDEYFYVCVNNGMVLKISGPFN